MLFGNSTIEELLHMIKQSDFVADAADFCSKLVGHKQSTKSIQIQQIAEVFQSCPGFLGEKVFLGRLLRSPGAPSGPSGLGRAFRALGDGELLRSAVG